jgi:FixJ family two-component response regulator
MSDPAPLVCVIDDDPSVRKALGRLLKAAGFRVAVFAAAEEFLAQPPPAPPDCLVLDVLMPGLSGLDLQRSLAERNAPVPIVFITGHGDVPTSVRAMKAGARDFLPKPFRAEELLEAVRQAAAGCARARQAGAETEEIRRRAESLSRREREVMALVVAGLLNKQAGRQLGVSEKTIKVHRARVMRKMRAASLADLVRMAERIGGADPLPTTAGRPNSASG